MDRTMTGRGKDTQPVRARALMERFRAFLIVLPVVGWIGYAWERATGLTFVFSRYVRIGSIANAEHVAGTLHNAVAVTVICVPLAIILHLLRDRPAA